MADSEHERERYAREIDALAEHVKLWKLAAEQRAAEVERLRGVLGVAAESCERDRREPDKILCHVLTMRREARS